MSVTSALHIITQKLIANEPDMHTEAARIAAMLRTGDCIRLEGTLGMGKTSFTRALIRTLSSADVEVSSPTFTLVQSYPILLNDAPAEFSHADLYRIESEHALEELGLHELPAKGVLCVEWPAIAEGWLPADALHIHLTPGESDTSRILTYSARTNSDWQTRGL